VSADSGKLEADKSGPFHVMHFTGVVRCCRAVFEKNRAFLSRGATSNVASLVNIEMELRKCCDHPFLLKVGWSRLAMSKSGVGGVSRAR
jgi:hypothetical protein